MLARKAASPVTSTSASTASSPTRRSASTEDWDADDESAMSNDEAFFASTNTSIPLSSDMPGSVGPYCPRRPTLREILANTSPAPWSLTAFMAYLSNNHCLETLEFTMDAGRYRKHFAKMMSRAPPGDLPPGKDREYVQALWQRLVDAYIKPDGTREVNLPSDVRDPILRQSPSDMPPAPEQLDAAVAKVYELMEDSVLVPFLNSAWPQSARSVIHTYSSMPADDTMSVVSDAASASQSSRYARRPDAPHSASDSHAYTNSKSSSSSKPTFSPALSGKSRFSAGLTTTTSAPSASVYRNQMHHHGSDLSLSTAAMEDRNTNMMDDSGSNANSPTHESGSTPPTSPPVSDASSPKRDSGMWKKLGRLGGMKSGGRKKSQAGLREE